MPILPENAEKIILPRMINRTQTFPGKAIEDISKETETALAGLADVSEIPAQLSGKRVALLVGSRNISGLPLVVKTTVDFLRRQGAEPFLVPSMGSHGGGVASAQKEILEGYGVTEEAMGAEILASMETVLIGQTKKGIPLYADRYAAEADFIIPIVRIKAHTSFSGPVESGFCKMLTIGLGKHTGCARLHQEGFEAFPELIPEAASVVLSALNVPFGVCVIENADEKPHRIAAVRGSEILSAEPELLKESKALMPRLCFDHIDVLVIEQIGKDISGTGMDPNITGRSVPGRAFSFNGPSVTRIVVLGLSEGTHGNASGIGRADFITKACFDAIDPVSTYANCIAAGVPDSARIPIVLPTEEEAIRAAIQTCPGIDPDNAKIVRIKDTLHLSSIQVSENMLPKTFRIGPIRPPSEANSLLLQITRGCTWNRCKFCGLYKKDTFQAYSVESIKRDIDAIAYYAEMIERYRNTDGSPDRTALRRETEALSEEEANCFYLVYNWLMHGGETVFLQDGNSLALKPERAAEVLLYLRSKFPGIKRITTYARAETLSKITAEEFRMLRAAGLDRIHSGFESGSDAVLSLINKGVTAEQEIRAGQNIKAAGIEFSVYFMPGIGGKALSEANATETARVVRAIDPDYVRIRSAVIVKRSALWEDIQSGNFALCGDNDKLHEIRLLIENTKDCTGTLVSDHIINLLQGVTGKLDQDHDKMLAMIDAYFALPTDRQKLFQLARRQGMVTSPDDLALLPASRLRELEEACRRVPGEKEWDELMNSLMMGYI